MRKWFLPLILIAAILFAAPIIKTVSEWKVTTTFSPPAFATASLPNPCTQDSLSLDSTTGEYKRCTQASPAIWTPIGAHAGQHVFRVAKSGAQFTTLCGAVCSSQTSDCVAGSAIAAIKTAADSSESNPYWIELDPGTYNECVTFNDVSDITLHLAGGSRIVPTVTLPTDVDGGVIRIANNTTAVVRRIRIVSDGYVRNDAFSAPEAVLQIGKESCTGTSPWDDIRIVGGVWIGDHDAIQWCGDMTSSDSATGMPKLFISETFAVAGTDVYGRKGNGVITGKNLYGLSMTNYCETTDTTITGANSGLVVGTGTTTTFTLQPTASNVNHAYAGRYVSLTGGTCVAGINAWINDSDTNRLVTTTASVGVIPDATCSYSIGAVPQAAEAPCHEVDWTTIRGASSGTARWWKSTAFHFGAVGTALAPDLDFTNISNSVFEVKVNDFGPASETSCSVGAQSNIAGILHISPTTRHVQTAIFDNITIRVQNNVRIRSDVACNRQVSCVVDTNGNFEDVLRFSGTCLVENTLDPNAGVFGIVSDISPIQIPWAHVQIKETAPGYVGTTAHLAQSGTGTLTVGKITSDVSLVTSGTINYLMNSNPVGDCCPATCSPGQPPFLDTFGATMEWCACTATNVWRCSPLSTLGPAD